eukprot:4881105-Prymnesium_polylepis.1
MRLPVTKSTTTYTASGAPAAGSIHKMVTKRGTPEPTEICATSGRPCLGLQQADVKAQADEGAGTARVAGELQPHDEEAQRVPRHRSNSALQQDDTKRADPQHGSRIGDEIVARDDGRAESPCLRLAAAAAEQQSDAHGRSRDAVKRHSPARQAAERMGRRGDLDRKPRTHELAEIARKAQGTKGCTALRRTEHVRD